MIGLRIDRPCRVRKAAAGCWEWTCLCSPAVWPCTSRETSWEAAQNAAAGHMAINHPAPVTVLAPVIDLAAYRATKVIAAGARVLAFVRPGGGAA
ncbi:hypothetical protein GCM10028799_11270 [Kribbella italica]